MCDFLMMCLILTCLITNAILILYLQFLLPRSLFKDPFFQDLIIIQSLRPQGSNNSQFPLSHPIKIATISAARL